MKTLPLYHEARPCVRSGYCCKKAVCPFGEMSDEGCVHLAGDGPGEYRCAIAEYITTQPGWTHSPAFGAGCCSPFNSDREAIKIK